MPLYCITLNSFYLFAPFLATLAWENTAPPVFLCLSYLHSLKNDANFRENLLSDLFIIPVASHVHVSKVGLPPGAGAEGKGVKL